MRRRRRRALCFYQLICVGFKIGIYCQHQQLEYAKMETQLNSEKQKDTPIKQAKYSHDQVSAILTTLKKMPKVEKKPNVDYLNKQTTIKMLSAEIQAMQRRGYELKDIAETLNGQGIDISTPTLKSYLQRTKDAKEAKKVIKVDKKSEQMTSINIQTQKPPPPDGSHFKSDATFNIKPDRNLS